MFLLVSSLSEPVNIEVRLPRGPVMCSGVTLLAHVSSVTWR